MTVAVCFSCGELKHGAFKPCGKCGLMPKDEDSMALSMALTDHYMGPDELRHLGQQIHKGVRVTLPPEAAENFKALIRQSGIAKVAEAASALVEGHDTPTGSSKPSATVSVNPTYIQNTEQTFALAHVFVDLRRQLNKSSGTLTSLFRSFFAKIDYEDFAKRAQGLKSVVDDLRQQPQKESPISSEADRYRAALQEYLAALYDAVSILANKTAFLARKAKSASSPGTSYTDFEALVEGEQASLEACQRTGDRLDALWRSYKAG
jgi:hypothetical protein